MLIWRGWGILVIVLAGVFLVGTQLIVNAVFGADMYRAWMGGIGLLLAAVAVWFLGRRLNGRPGRTLVDQATGQRMVLRRKHDLFFIKMEYWAPILAVLGVVLLITGSR